MKPKYVLDKPDSQDLTYIFLLMTLSDGRLKLSTREKILSVNWDFVLQKPILPGRDPREKRQLQAVHSKLATIDFIVSDYELDARIAGRKPKKSELKALLDPVLAPPKEIPKNDIFSALKQIILEMDAGAILTPQNKLYGKGTLRTFKSSIANLQKFHALTGQLESFESITLQTYKSLVTFLTLNQDHSANTTGRIIKHFKTLMRIAQTKGMHSNSIYTKREFKTIKEDSTDIYLTDDELDAIYNLPLTGLDDIVRDWFIFDCYTGLRVSDIQGLTNDDIKDDRIVSINVKTDERVILPIHPRIKALLKKHNGIPRKTADQVLNRYIKDIAFKAGINSRVDFMITKGGKRVKEKLQKWQMVSNHTARRTFITNLLKAGIDTISVMHLAGIKKLETLQKYNKLTVDETADIVAKHHYFK